MDDKILVECICGCGLLKINKIEVYSDEELERLKLGKSNKYEYSLQYLTDTFSSKQHGLIYTIKHRIKLIWNIVRGKEYLLEEILLDQDQIDILIKKLSNPGD